MLHPAAVLAEADRLGASPLWAGFDPRTVPVLFFDGERSWLCRHPAPPAEFISDPESGAAVFEGRHPEIFAATAMQLGGLGVAVVPLGMIGAVTVTDAAAISIHEAFHVFQRSQFPEWGMTEAESFTYPVEEAKGLALRRLETEALRRALETASPSESLGWAGAALSLRRERLDRLPAGPAQYESGMEALEGTALYVEMKARGETGHLLPAEEFAPGAVRQRCYATGRAIALLLDRHAPGWQEALADRRFRLPVEILASVATQPLDFPLAELAAAMESAQRDVAELLADRARRRLEFFARPGRVLVIEAGEALLRPQAFDPMNLHRLDGLEVLHTRALKLGNQAGSFEVWDRGALTEGAGGHPLFRGIARVTLAGVERLQTELLPDGRITVSGPGIQAELQGGAVEESADRVVIKI